MTENVIKQKIEALLKDTSFNDRIPARNDLNKENLKEIISETRKTFLTPDIIDEIVSDFAFEEVLDKTKSDETTKGTKKFSDLPNVNTKEVTNKIYTFISELPKDYAFVFKLPKSTVGIEKISFAKNIEMLTITSGNIKQYVSQETQTGRLASMIAGYGRNQPELNEGDVILRISGKGYVGKYGSIKMLDLIDPLYTFKVILGIYISLEIITRKQIYDSFSSNFAYRYSIYDDKNAVIRDIDESTEDTEYMARMEFNNDKFEHSDLDKIIKKKTTAFEDANNIIMNTVYALKPEGNKQALKRQRMIKNGAYWFYESLKTSQEHIRTIFCTTSYDSLLEMQGADEKQRYKAEIISNAIANDVLEADIIRNNIFELYSLRNKIVHGEKAISSLERYGNLEDNPSKTTSFIGLAYLIRFFANRLIFINKGLSILTGIK